MANFENRINYQPPSEKSPLPEKYTGPVGRMRFAVDYVARVTKLILYAGITGEGSLPKGKEDKSLISLILDNRKQTL